MREISGCDINFFYIIELEPLEDLGFWESKASKCQKFSIQALFKVLVFAYASGLGGANLKIKNKIKRLVQAHKSSNT